MMDLMEAQRLFMDAMKSGNKARCIRAGKAYTEALCMAVNSFSFSYPAALTNCRIIVSEDFAKGTYIIFGGLLWALHKECGADFRKNGGKFWDARVSMSVAWAEAAYDAGYLDDPDIRSAASYLSPGFIHEHRTLQQSAIRGLINLIIQFPADTAMSVKNYFFYTMAMNPSSFGLTIPPLI